MSEEFIREVDEDLRHQQMKNLWKKYGSYVIAFLVGTVLFVAGNVSLRNYNEGQYAKVADQYSAVEQSVTANDMDDALKKLGLLSDTDVVGYKILAAFREADIELSRNNNQKAVAVLDKLSKASDVDQYYRDLSALKAGMIILDDATFDDAQSRLTPLTIEGNPWKYMAKELLAMAAIKNGNMAEAKEILTQLEQDLEAPQDVKDRAKNFRSVID
ncbi:MAG: tetratricopeptide repeat protein [Emcibacter sp.]|nr:tetratricopeptide repeat protein [Emcibacter sp.]